MDFSNIGKNKNNTFPLYSDKIEMKLSDMFILFYLKAAVTKHVDTAFSEKKHIVGMPNVEVIWVYFVITSWFWTCIYHIFADNICW